jgi:hypothetical protein
MWPMRCWGLVLIAYAGCGFRTTTPGSDAEPPSGDTATGDTMPDAQVFMPACLTASTYTEGPTGHRYRVLTGLPTYDTMFDQCAADGAHPAVVDSMAENMYLASLIGGDTWIGFDDLTTEGTFRWATGATPSFLGWVGSEPNQSGNEDCTTLTPDGAWNDIECYQGYPGICECDPLYQPPPTPACRTMNGYSLIFGRRYFINTTARTWAAAAADCAAIGAHLAVPGDADENSEIDFSFIGESWIGYSDSNTEGSFAWINEAPKGFERWDGGAPAASPNTEDCVAIMVSTPPSEWDDRSCDELRQYACECDPSAP